MVEESSKASEDSIEKDTGEERSPSSGCSRYSRVSENEGVESWLRAKEERGLRKIQKGNTGRTGFSGARSQLKKVSDKQKKKNAEYKQSLKEHYETEVHQKCFLCGREDNLSVHHIKKRLNNISNEMQFVTLCLVGDYMDRKYPDANHTGSGCHSFVHANPSIARELGLIK